MDFNATTVVLHMGCMILMTHESIIITCTEGDHFMHYWWFITQYCDTVGGRLLLYYCTCIVLVLWYWHPQT